MKPSRRFVLLLLTVGCFGLSVPSAWATFSNQTARAAVSSFTTTSLNAPTIGVVQRCTVSLSVIVNWTPSTSTFVSSQLVEISTSATLATITASFTANDNTTQAHTFTGINPLTTYYARVTGKFQSWSTASTIATAALTVC